VIDDAVRKHGPKVRFLSFRQVQDRLNVHLLGGQALRASNGQDNGVRLLDLNADGFLDVVIGNEHVRQTRLWNPLTSSWTTGSFPVPLIAVTEGGARHDMGVRLGVVQENGFVSLLVRNGTVAGLWHFDGAGWRQVPQGLDGLELDSRPIQTSHGDIDRGIRLRDLDADGCCELVVGNPTANAVFCSSETRPHWRRFPFGLPENTSIVDSAGRDAGLRFVDVNQDGFDDVLFSNAEGYRLCLFHSIEEGWARTIRAGRRGPVATDDDIPMIVRADGTSNGAWFSEAHLWIQNEDTGKAMPDHVDGRSFGELLKRHVRTPK